MVHWQIRPLILYCCQDKGAESLSFGVIIDGIIPTNKVIGYRTIALVIQACRFASGGQLITTINKIRYNALLATLCYILNGLHIATIKCIGYLSVSIYVS